MQDSHFLLPTVKPEQWTTSTIINLADSSHHGTLASTHLHFKEIQWKSQDHRGTYYHTISSSLAFYPNSLPPASHSIRFEMTMMMMMMMVLTAMRPAVLCSPSHIKWAPNLVRPLWLTHVFTSESTWLMGDPQNPHLHNRKSNPSL